MKAPKNWSEVTIAQYYNLCEAISMDWETNEDKAVAMLSALSGVSILELNEVVPLPELKEAIKGIAFIGEDRTDGKVKPILWVGTRKFEIDLMIRESTASSFISLADLTKDKETSKTNLHSIMAVFAYEVNWFNRRKKRTAASQKEIAEYFRENLTMDKAFIYSGFFLRSWENLSKVMLDYLNKENEKIAKEIFSLIEQDS